MNRSELAALLAANPPVPPSASSPPIMVPDHMHSPATSSPNSPRLNFQFRVRSLQRQRSPSRSSFSTHLRRHSELEHVSTLRVTHKRSRSALPISRDTPNFWAEEREAWGQRSPQSPQRRLTSTEAGVVSPSRSKLQPVLSPPRSQTHSIPQPRKQSRDRVPLRTFEPLNTIPDADERPKTARGPQNLEILEEENEEDKGEEAGQVEEDHDDGEAPRLSTSTNQTARASKFLEGSMNERSFGIASSWFHEVRSDSDKPLPPTPAAKHVTFSCTPVRESLDDEQEQVTDLPTTKRKERRGLRRSISNFNFQALSEKMKIFAGGHHHDVGPIESGEKKKAQKSDATGVDLLNERKRKADEAYAAQFGFKKQKFSAPSSNDPAPSPNVGGGGNHVHKHSRNVDQNSHHHFRTSSRRPTATSSSTAPSLRKKKSRSELERENSELRARLAAQQNSRHVQQQHHRQGYTAAGKPAATSEHFIRGGKVIMLSPGKNRGRMGEDVPPVPPIPRGRVLGVLENTNKQENRKAGERGVGSLTKRKSGSDGGWEGVRVGLEEGGSLALGKPGPGNASPRKSFEWPEDVF